MSVKKPAFSRLPSAILDGCFALNLVIQKLKLKSHRSQPRLQFLLQEQQNLVLLQQPRRMAIASFEPGFHSKSVVSSPFSFFLFVIRIRLSGLILLIRTSRKIETYTPKTLSLHLGYISTTYIKNPAFTITSHYAHR